ncbi:hypothetical protein KY290_024891 [Solanum tuberosum]|uniref:Uncharacterized protein n=1 Tax=Solanum tuberosum TaxID=4113 RepID=A0ABQ7URY6_SOLTU|nr:hypothetical protein KY290_024891 [Solanum tuberosum]
MIGNNKGLNSSTYTQNVVAQKINVVPPGFDALEDETSFPNDDLEVMQDIVTSKLAKENGHNITYVCSVKGSNVVQRTSIGKSKNYCVPSSHKNELAHNKNLMQPGFDPIEVDTFFPCDDLEVIGRGNRFTSLSSNVIPQKTNVVCPDFDAIEVETSFPHDDHEVMQGNMRSKPGKENGKNITFVGSARGSTFVQRTSIGKSKGYSVISSDMNEPAHNKIIRQPKFNLIGDDASFPRDDLEAMQEALRSKSARERPQSFTYVGSPRRCAEKRTSNGKNKFSRNTEYDLNELTQYDLTLPQDEVEVMQDTRRCKTKTAIDHVLKHMRRLWNNWRGSLHMNVKSKPLQEVLKDVPEGVDKSDWKLLVKEHFLSEKFKEKSTRNTMNRSKLSIPHRTGSKPIREIIYELGGKHGNPLDMATIFFETRKKDNKLLEPETNQKYSLNHIVGFGGGITSKDLKGGSSAKAALLEQLNVSRKEKAALLKELNASRKENESMKRHMDNIKKRCEIFESTIFRDPSSPPSSSEQNIG